MKGGAMTIHIISGTMGAKSSLVLRDDSGHTLRISVRGAVPAGGEPGAVPVPALHVKDLGLPIAPSNMDSPQSFKAACGSTAPKQELPEAISLAPSWGVSCPHCGGRNTVYYLHAGCKSAGRNSLGKCDFCGGEYRVPDGALTCDEARGIVFEDHTLEDAACDAAKDKAASAEER